MATKVIIPASLDGSNPRAALWVADGLGEDPEAEVWDPDEDPGEEEDPDEGLPPVALALKASNVLSAVGLTAKTIPAWQCPVCLQ